MLKAIWPSTANIPNHLPESSHITTVGSCARIRLSVDRCWSFYMIRHDVLFSLLGRPISIDVRLASKYQISLHCQRGYRSFCLAEHLDMVLHQSSCQNKSWASSREPEWKFVELGMVERIEWSSRDLCDTLCQHPWFHCKYENFTSFHCFAFLKALFQRYAKNERA